MNGTCFGPPPLPPNKRALTRLSSTYLSFRDPADEITLMDQQPLSTFKSPSGNSADHRKQRCRYNKPAKIEETHFQSFEGTHKEYCCRHSYNKQSRKHKSLTHKDDFKIIDFDMISLDFNGNSPVAGFPYNDNDVVERKLSNTNSLRRSFRGGVMPRLTLAKWRSEGNLANAFGAEVGPFAQPQLPIARFDKCLRALSGSWKNLLQLGGMSRPPKATPQAKRVPPPAVPDVYRLSGSSFGSAGYASSEDAVFLAPDNTNVIRDDHSDYGSTVSGPGKSPGPGGYSQPQFTFPPNSQGGPSGPVLTHKAAVYYHHQLALQEDQGIDMTQSPGRDSPGSSSGSAGSGSRHSTASLDSGRASGYLGPPRGALGSASSPRCSLSSCSLGSEHGRVERLMHQGVPDHDIIHAWLVDLQFEEYAPLFAAAGYDLPTITRMTPEDLTAIGIKKPNHRKRLKSEIAQLVLPDNLPDYIPGSMEEWLRLLRLEEYAPALISQGYQSVQDVTQLTWEDLEDIGIVRLGHQKKILLAIKRVKDIRAGKRFPSHTGPQHGQDVIVVANDSDGVYNVPGHVHAARHAYQQPWEVQQSRTMSASCHPAQVYYGYNVHAPTDIVPIQIRQGRGKSLESLEDSERSTHLTFSAEPVQVMYSTGPTTGPTWRRSYDDGDITPTNEAAILGTYEGGGTLPRPRGLVRPRPVAKISANVCAAKQNQNTFQDFEKIKFPEQYQQNCQNEYQYGNKYLYSPHLGKKMPPEPPKRQSSAPAENLYQTTVEIHAETIPQETHAKVLGSKSLPLSLPAYPSSDSLSCVSLESDNLPLPPPPAPCTPQGIMPSRSWAAPSEELALINTLASQAKIGSDSSFKSSSSTESDSLPFANENAGTIKQRTITRATPMEFGRPGLPRAGGPPSMTKSLPASQCETPTNNQSSEPADVLSDIGNMLANLTDELDAMLEEEKRQGLADAQ